MGARGPVPKRSTQRRRTNKTATPRKAGAAAAKVVMPKPDTGWHPTAAAWYTSLAQSGQSAFYEPSDWALAFLIAESLSRDLLPQVVGITEDGEPVHATIPMKGASLSSYLKAMTALLVTEGDRRRAQVELQRSTSTDAPVDDGVPSLDDYRRRVAG